ncbi:MAG: tRNA uridine-5-carboxymethylaminomethyl(34) synthesis GTPase MnmE [Candidatus Berkiella sp.]
MVSSPLADTIVAVATAPGKGGIGVVRVSGSEASSIAMRLLNKQPAPRVATLCEFRHPHHHQIIDQGVALYFPAPHSFTGEDVLELQGHGGPVVMDCLLKAVVEAGARLARPGEFSERSFLNDKMDLAQAEAVADLIDATTEAAALGAMRSLQGHFSEKIATLAQSLMRLRLYVEAAIDFPEEEIDFLADGHILQKIEEVISQLQELQASAKQGQLLKEGMSVVIIGRPNAGKSSLLNALTGQASAIVTPIPGTTRDLVKETIQIEGMPLHIVDTAGIRLEAEEVEQEGIRRALLQQDLADRILLVVDASKTPLMTEVEQQVLSQFAAKTTLIVNKVDIAPITNTLAHEAIALSAKTGEGLHLLKEHLKNIMGYRPSENGTFIARRRHLTALSLTLDCCEKAKDQLVRFKAGELVAQELKMAQDALGEITGKVTTDDLLGEIFANFCIGK